MNEEVAARLRQQRYRASSTARQRVVLRGLHYDQW